jgi:Ca-activated chloride channel family protein
MPRSHSRVPVFLLLTAVAVGLLLGWPATDAAADPQRRSDDFKISRDVNLVVLHTTVLDRRGHFVPDLLEQHFRVFEDNVEQKLSVFRREDIPVTAGLVIDNSGSMRDKRERVNAGALTFVEASNPEDEIFVVNFNDDYYLDIEKNFTNDVRELKEALERIDSRGSTALYDAVVGSLDHMKKGTRDKRVLVVITDGEDNASRKSLEQTVQEVQLSNTLIYAIGLLSQESRRSARRARNALERLTEASGGLSFFPEGVHDVEAICLQIAHDIRNQYTLAYYPTNTKKDGSFRSVRVEVNAPRNYGRVSVRTRTGYYAQTETPAN